MVFLLKATQPAFPSQGCGSWPLSPAGLPSLQAPLTPCLRASTLSTQAPGGRAVWGPLLRLLSLLRRSPLVTQFPQL